MAAMSNRPTGRPANRTPSRRARRWLAGLAMSAAAVSAASPNAARAAEEEVEHYDARVQGYSPDVESKSSSVGMIWVLAILLGGATIGVMFIDSKRSHLD